MESCLRVLNIAPMLPLVTALTINAAAVTPPPAPPNAENSISFSQISPLSAIDMCYDPFQTADGAIYVMRNEAMERNLEKVKRFRKLDQAGWNGYGADPIERSLIYYAEHLIRSLGWLQPEVFPVPNGSIQLEYEKPDGSYLEFEVPRSGRIGYLCIDADGHSEENTIARNVNVMLEKVRAFYGE